MQVISRDGFSFELSAEVEQLICELRTILPTGVVACVFSHIVDDGLAFGIGGYRREDVEAIDSVGLASGTVWLAISDAARAKLAGAKLTAVGRRLQVEGAHAE